MELPQLTLYLRRMLASPRGLAWREALRTPRVRALLLILGCVIGTTAQMYLTLRLNGIWSPINWLGVSSGELPEYCYFFLGLCGVWAILFLAADQMSSLALQSRRAPDWHSSPLPSAAAVISTLLAALLASLPAVVSLALFIGLAGGSMWANPYNEAWMPAGVMNGAKLLHLLFMLPAFCLAAGSLTLAARHSPFAPYIPGLLAFSGTAVSTIRFELNSGQLPHQTILSVGYLVAVLLLVGLLALICTKAAASQDPSRLTASTLVIFLGLPLLTVAQQLLQMRGLHYWRPRSMLDLTQHSSFIDESPAICLRWATGLVFPTSFWGSYAERWMLPGSALLVFYKSSLVMLPVCASLLWYFTCVRSLDAARGIVRLPARRAVKTRTLGLEQAA